MPSSVEPGFAGPLDTPLGVFSGDWGTAAVTLLVVLIAVSVGAWAFVVWMGAGMTSAMMLASISTWGGFALFLAVWMVMMVAMMFPAAAPMAQAYSALSGHEDSARPTRSALTSVFLATYVVVWTAVGIVVAIAYLLLAPELPVLVGTGTLGVTVAGSVLIAAGIYQTTPLKQSCLRGCRTPVSFLLTDWRPGFRGAVHLGLRHAAYCVGCCGLLFAVLFAVGIMALPWMALIALLIFVEKLLPGRTGFRVSVGLGGALAIVGVAFLVFPAWGAWATGLPGLLPIP
jgi:predicted metal-binding membrane protein